MLFGKVRSFFHTLAFRLTVWYAGIFTLCSILAFLVFYLHVASILSERTEEELLEEIQEFSALLASNGIEELKQALVIEARDDGEDKVFYRLLTPSGKEIASSNPASWSDLQASPDALKQIAGGKAHVFETVSLRDKEYKVRTLYGPIGPGAVLQIGWLLEEDAEFVAILREVFGTTVAAVMIFAALVGWVMAKRALSGVEAVTRTAREISAQGLERRVSVKTKTSEIERLATTFNDMLDRIESLVTEMKEMTDNIAHDLKSPITRIRGIAEMTLTGGKSIDEHESAAANTIEQCDRLLEMINTMLYISETEAGAGSRRRESIDMAVVVRDACELFQPMAEDKGVNLAAQIDGDLKVEGDRQALQRMIANLIDNAINNTPSQGAVTVSVDGDEKLGIISVRDTGIGISQTDLPHVFKRFYRCDRSRSSPGNGLGLSLVKAVVHSHGGQVVVSSTPDNGTQFTVSLPRFS
ncbi:MAG: ATP-binding protein [Acidiferrobacterales bacterium]|nr:ATP-binding protein [Acidiferrobacterales bacterium]